MKLSMLSTTRSGHNFIKEVIESWLPGIDITVMERTIPKDIYKYKLDAHSPRVIVLREFRNCIASTLYYYGTKLKRAGVGVIPESNIKQLTNAYWAQVEEAISGEYYDADTIIYYDRFCEDQTYRKDICALLGGQYTEDRLGFVSDEGAGSSFDGLTMQGEGQKMKTRSRHEQILETEWADTYTRVLGENEELMNKYETFFEGLL